VLVNDVHSQLNATRVHGIVRPRNIEELRLTILRARREGRAVCIAGGRHAMGGQAFASGAILIDMRSLDRVLRFDTTHGRIVLEAGIQWPKLLRNLHTWQSTAIRAWAFTQKQTGADRLTIGGTLAANGHGRGLTLPPFGAEVEEIALVDHRGELRHCSRSEMPELFSLVIGGYGLFGVVYAVTLRLMPRLVLKRVVEVRPVEGLHKAFQERIREGYLYGDFQYAIDERSEDFMRRGVFSCYQPLDVPSPAGPPGDLSEKDWIELLYLAHADKGEAFRRYAEYYLSTNGRLYWSDEHQMSLYPDDYHRVLDRRLKSPRRATEAITEIYCEREALEEFMAAVREDARRNRVNIIYGTVRLIEQDRDSFLAWAKKPYACVIFNLHVEHTPQGIRHASDAFRRLIDIGLRYGGSYFPTYHRYATRAQVEACYPRFAEFLRLKRKYDPNELFQSEWYRHYKAMFA
jgi:FAD/FMN-containing dehydrogenase